MNTAGWIEHQGRKILFFNHRGLQEDEVIANQQTGFRLFKESLEQDILTLTDMTGVYATPKVDEVMRQTNHDMMPRTKKAAVSGTTMVTTGIIRTFARTTATCSPRSIRANSSAAFRTSSGSARGVA